MVKFRDSQQKVGTGPEHLLERGERGDPAFRADPVDMTEQPLFPRQQLFPPHLQPGAKPGEGRLVRRTTEAAVHAHGRNSVKLRRKNRRRGGLGHHHIRAELAKNGGPAIHKTGKVVRVAEPVCGQIVRIIDQLACRGFAVETERCLHGGEALRSDHGTENVPFPEDEQYLVTPLPQQTGDGEVAHQVPEVASQLPREQDSAHCVEVCMSALPPVDISFSTAIMYIRSNSPRWDKGASLRRK